MKLYEVTFSWSVADDTSEAEMDRLGEALETLADTLEEVARNQMPPEAKLEVSEA